MRGSKLKSLEVLVKLYPGKNDSLTQILQELDDFFADQISQGQLEGYRIEVNGVVADVQEDSE